MRSLLFALTLLSSTPALADPLFADAIFNGRPVASGGQTWRSTVGLSFNGYACTGVFVARDLILTAAHCSITNDSEINVDLRKENSLSETRLTYAPGEFQAFRHPNYIPLNNPNSAVRDLQLVVLKRRLLPDGFVPAQILPPSLSALADKGGTITMVGAGTNGTGAFSDRLYFTEGTIAAYYSNISVIAVALTEGTGICGGDSGGPVFTKNKGTLYVSAIINASADPIAQRCGKILYAARVDDSAVSWIETTAASARRGL